MNILSEDSSRAPILRPHIPSPFTEPAWVRYSLILFTILFLCLFLILPVIGVLTEAFREGIHVYFQSLIEPAAYQALFLTLKVTSIVVPCHIILGISIAWLTTRFNFAGKSVLMTLIDLPFAVSPVVAGLMLVLLFGSQSFFGKFLIEHGMTILFDTPGLVIATLFVTFPFIARELIPLMAAQGADEEYAAVTLGAHGWQIFWHVTLPNIKWALLDGIILCAARSIGEFGAVAVVSGHIRGLTNTVPLHIEILYNEYRFAAAFAMASLLMLIALVLIGLRIVFEKKQVNGL